MGEVVIGEPLAAETKVPSQAQGEVFL